MILEGLAVAYAVVGSSWVPRRFTATEPELRAAQPTAVPVTGLVGLGVIVGVPAGLHVLATLLALRLLLLRAEMGVVGSPCPGRENRPTVEANPLPLIVEEDSGVLLVGARWLLLDWVCFNLAVSDVSVKATRGEGNTY